MLLRTRPANLRSLGAGGRASAADGGRRPVENRTGNRLRAGRAITKRHAGCFPLAQRGYIPYLTVRPDTLDRNGHGPKLLQCRTSHSVVGPCVAEPGGGRHRPVLDIHNDRLIRQTTRRVWPLARAHCYQGWPPYNCRKSARGVRARGMLCYRVRGNASGRLAGRPDGLRAGTEFGLAGRLDVACGHEAVTAYRVPHRHPRLATARLRTGSRYLQAAHLEPCAF